MEQGNYYAVLGVSPNEGPSGIRRAFRDLALRYHPDRAGPATTRSFQDIVQAYEVLSDPARRAEYDREHRPRVAIRVAGAGAPEAFMVPPLHLMRDFVVTSPPASDIFDEFFRAIGLGRETKSGRGHALDLELILSSTEAWAGGTIPLIVPAFRPCKICHGTGHSFDYFCPRCSGSGMIEIEETARVKIPPRLIDGTVLTIPLQQTGMSELFLRILVRVSHA